VFERRSPRSRLLVAFAAGACLAALLAPGTAVAGRMNGAHAADTTRRPVGTPIEVDAGWRDTFRSPPAFFWDGPGPVFNADGPFTYTSDVPTILKVTDSFCPGDRFRVFDNGAPIGDTTDSARGRCRHVGPHEAFRSSRYSHGAFELAPGEHVIAIQLIRNPFSGGRGFLRVDSVPVRKIGIDVKPGSGAATINVRSHGRLPVAILSEKGFFPQNVDASTICFGSARDPFARNCHALDYGVPKDVNGDGVDDLLLRFKTRRTGIRVGDTRACLTGRTLRGGYIAGCDRIRAI